MPSLLEQFNSKYLASLNSQNVLNFRAGDTLQVSINILNPDGQVSRVQKFEGVCIAVRKKGIDTNFTVRKLSAYNISVEKSFLLYSSLITIKVMRRGDVRRAKLYYLRKLHGKSAKIKELRR
ncbi:MAG: ribosomal protein L19 [Candidatus Xenolissoclinum pacificiensis L6]|uniref:Large ribosomal subunit protein bL19 n=1 Tax=Candidatus Xenolissoclinum pacificiensis L6 TaxID=1401685 RepID=W2UZS7_9RICK|nr:MAG: ribosomal protein L19 [Candidatus Xenolissoclinum pacificiensis L6]